ncbi:FimV/HubP family polar landmark protein [Halomonas sp. LR5S13]|uniref:FimV/HubP family polar landmark protein n=1 Tax=Halomonas rhizosphaerae TaxID=3043296 RepID=UPI0024A80B64|nr:FimV/HubP family polar landmark protein [Halomonas rhizosphaerae]MDI5921820.1 FimV/HubP family polar landmark protein [Halomonas rhizosphaerae]
MKRKLTLAMLLSLSAASPLALALGLGEAEVNSTLNAPLRASIPLTDSSGLQAELLNVSVADARAFSAAGLPRTPLAASVKMDVTQRQGRLVVDLTTERAVREPWVDLLLRFDWPGGQQLREVTLLLDPPDYDQLPALVAASSTAPREAASTPRSSAPAAESSSRPVARTSGAGSGDPAWVRNGDTLWAVAGRLRPDSGISMNQMMVALVEANPEVFPSGNINAMRAGFTLVVPSREAIAARSSAEAGRVVQAMNQAWANRGSGAPARVALGGPSDAPASAVASAPSQEGTSTEPADEVQPEAVETASSDAAIDGEDATSEEGQRLTLLSDAEVAAEGVVPVEGVSDQQEGESSAGATQEEEEEEEAAADSLAMPAGSEGEGPFIDPEVLALIQGGGELTEDQRLLRLEARWLENRQALEVVRSERDELQSQLGDLREELEAMRDQLATITAGGQGADAPGSGGVVAPGSEQASSQQAPWWGALYQGGTDRNLMLGGAGLAALLALWALVRRRRREESEPAPVFNEARAVDPAASGVVVPGSPQAQAREAEVRGEEREAPVRASMPEAEAINEADIFIAYGRYDQARELLESSLAREPGRDDLRLKLLRVQLEQGEHAAAARQAEQLRAGGDPDVQAEVARLMERHVRSAPSAPAAAPVAETTADRAVFPEADELPPRRFDEHDAPGDADAHDEPATDDVPSREAPSRDTPSRDTPSAEAPKGASTSQAMPDEAAPVGEQADPLARYRPPELEPGPQVEPQEDDAPRQDAEASSDLDGEASGEVEQPHEVSGEQEPEPADELPSVPLASRQADDGREIIDYRPPTLEERPAPREETPMQPSVEFTSSADGDDESPNAMPGIRAERDMPEEWDVEEVAFPPLSRDNAHFSAAASSTSTLAEARRLLDAGEAGQARALLESLIDESDDPEARQEARELLDQSVQ